MKLCNLPHYTALLPVEPYPPRGHSECGPECVKCYVSVGRGVLMHRKDVEYPDGCPECGVKHGPRETCYGGFNPDDWGPDPGDCW